MFLALCLINRFICPKVFYMITLEEIAFNSLMPWSERNSDEILFEELVTTLDEITGYDPGLYFSRLSNLCRDMGLKLPPHLIIEWEKFTAIHLVPPDSLYAAFGAYRHQSAKVRFYARLAAYCASAEIQNLEKEFKTHKSDEYRQYETTRLAGRLERIIITDMQVKEHGEDDLLIIKLLKTGALMAYLELIQKHGNLIPTGKLKLSPEGSFEQLASIALNSDSLKNVAIHILKQYDQYFEPCANVIPYGDKKTTTSPKKKAATGNINKSSGKTDKDTKGMTEEDRQGDMMTAAEKMADNSRLIGSGEAMKLLGIKRATLKRYRDSGILTYLRPNPKGKILYRLADIQKVMELKGKPASNLKN